MQTKWGRGLGLLTVACVAATFMTGCSTDADNDYVTKAQERCQGKDYDDLVCLLGNGQTTDEFKQSARELGLASGIWDVGQDGSVLTKGIEAIAGYGPYCAVVFRKVDTDDYSFGLAHRHLAESRTPITAVENSTTAGASKILKGYKSFCENGALKKGGVVESPTPTLQPA